jgi:hypothetical protein
MAAMQVDKLDVDSYLATAASSAPSDLHPFFEKFRKQHERKCVWCSLSVGDILNRLTTFWDP